MKTKHLLFASLFMLFIGANPIKAQSWAPVGAIWHYTRNTEFPPYVQSYIKIISEKDTIINSVSCRKLIRFKPAMISGTPNVYRDILYMYELNHKVYYYVNSLNRFCLLYDFNANAGDSWVLDEFPAAWGDTIKVISTGTININGHQKKTMQITNTCAQYGFGGTLIEDIGNTLYMFPTFDMNFEGPLRCYQDNILGLYNTEVAPSCEFTTVGIEEYTDKDNIFIYPNPANNTINIIIDNNSNAIVKIINAKGQLINEIKSVKEHETIDVSGLPAGMYIVQLVFDNKIVNKKIQISN